MIYKILDWLGVGVVICFLVFGVTMCSNQQQEKETKRPAGKARFLYSAGGCNVYRISDGNNENQALLTRCPNSVTTSETQKTGSGKSEKKIEVTNTVTS